MPTNPPPPDARPASPTAYRPQQSYWAPPPTLRGMMASVRAMLESPGRISDDMARDLSEDWSACALARGIITPNELRRAMGIPCPPIIPRTGHMPPRPMPAPAPARPMVCLGCGAPIGGAAVCGYCLRRS